MILTFQKVILVKIWYAIIILRIIEWSQGAGGDIPDDPDVAFKQNALTNMRLKAVSQCQQMTTLVDQVKMFHNDILIGYEDNFFCHRLPKQH